LPSLMELHITPGSIDFKARSPLYTGSVCKFFGIALPSLTSLSREERGQG
jgi:hypothetical protein